MAGSDPSMAIPFDNTYSRLPERFYARVTPTKVREPRIVKANGQLAVLLGIDPDLLGGLEGASILSGNSVPEGASPIALAYAGHQFGHFVPQLGDGRAILLGEVVALDGVRRDIQLKGAGRTPFSRGGDGRAALGPVMREYIVSEAMAAMGVPTTRALAAVTTGEPVVREERLPGAVLTRVAASHLRVGTFEYFAVRQDREALTILVDYALERHYSGAASNVGDGRDCIRLLDCVITAQASLVAQWLGIGFVHGVMNTDNTSISGETIDFGPCAFLDEYDPTKKFSSIDHAGRYAFGNQPRIARWNLARFAETLLPLIDENIDEAARLATQSLERFDEQFQAAYTRVMCAKIGLKHYAASDQALVDDLLIRLAANRVDYTLFFRLLCAAAEGTAVDAQLASWFESPELFRAWAEPWRRRLAEQGLAPAECASIMRRANPALIPRNHRVEQAIVAGSRGDFEPFHALVDALQRPYDEPSDFAYLAESPKPDERVLETFCGT